jgi:hypothetical protein
MDRAGNPANGRVRLLLQMALILFFSIFVTWIYMQRAAPPLSSPAGQSALATRVARILLTLLLMIMVYRGSVIAKWIAVVLYGAAVVIVIPGALASWLLFALVVNYAVFLLILLFSADVRAFLEQQRAQRKSTFHEIQQPPA